MIKKEHVLYLISLLIVAGFVGLLIFLSSGDAKGDNSTGTEVVVNENGEQIITIIASNGYSPASVTAKGGIPTILKVKSEQAYGCESSLRIPSLNISKYLPANGETEIDLGIRDSGSEITGTCSMGMYHFEIKFT
jgi:plastocyanin domain-containing protein